jgi:6-phosphogluconolactonase
MSYHVYVTASGDGRIARFSMDRDTAALERRKDVPLPGRPAPIALHPDQGFMHVARRDANLITSFRIDKASGDLSEIGTVPTVADPCHMSVDRSGRFLLAAYYLSKKVTVRHALGAPRVGAPGRDGTDRRGPAAAAPDRRAAPDPVGARELWRRA